MRKIKNPIPLQHLRLRGFADEMDEPNEYSIKYPWDYTYNHDTYEDLDLRHMNFWEAEVINTVFLRCDMRNSDFRLSDLSDCKFNDSNLKGSLFHHTRLTRTDFKGCDLSDSFFSSETSLVSCKLEECNLNGARIFGEKSFIYITRLKQRGILIFGTPNYVLINCDLQGANLIGADLRGVDLSGANLQGANLQDADLSGANLQSANLQDADLQGSIRNTSKLQGANLQGANLQSAKYNKYTQGLTDEQKSVMVFVDEDKD